MKIITFIKNISVLERNLNPDTLSERVCHSHLYGQFVFVKSGILYGRTENKYWLVKPKMSIWIPPNTKHSAQAYNQVNLIVIYVPSEFCSSYILTLKLIDSSMLINALCEKLINLNIIDTKDTKNRYLMILELLLSEIQELPSSKMILPLPQDSRLKKLTNYLINNPMQRHTLGEWAKKIGSTERTLSRLFIKETGLRYLEWYNRLLLDIAIKGLEEKLSNDVLAETLGFSSASSFSHWFKKVTGFYPRVYRKKVLNIQ